MISHYFAYGSNMNPTRIRARGLRFTQQLAGRLRGFELRFDKRATDGDRIAHANIGHARGGVVQGVLYRLRWPSDILRLDRYEGSPVRYSREVFRIETACGDFDAWVYVANPAMIGQGLLPERRYLNHLLAARPWHTPAYHQWLRAQPCIDGGYAVAFDSCKGLLFND